MSSVNKAILFLHPGDLKSGTAHRNVHSPTEKPKLEVSSGLQVQLNECYSAKNKSNSHSASDRILMLHEKVWYRLKLNFSRWILKGLLNVPKANLFITQQSGLTQNHLTQKCASHVISVYNYLVEEYNFEGLNTHVYHHQSSGQRS